MRWAVTLVLAVIAGCGGAHSAGPDRCAEAATSGPPDSVTCPPETTRVVTVERAAGRVVPGPRGVASPLAEIATSEWCADATGEAVGPYLARDVRRSVIRSGLFAGGKPAGTWVAWNGRGAPTAVTAYDSQGELASQAPCVP